MKKQKLSAFEKVAHVYSDPTVEDLCAVLSLPVQKGYMDIEAYGLYKPILHPVRPESRGNKELTKVLAEALNFGLLTAPSEEELKNQKLAPLLSCVQKALSDGRTNAMSDVAKFQEVLAEQDFRGLWRPGCELYCALRAVDASISPALKPQLGLIGRALVGQLVGALRRQMPTHDGYSNAWPDFLNSALYVLGTLEDHKALSVEDVRGISSLLRLAPAIGKGAEHVELFGSVIDSKKLVSISWKIYRELWDEQLVRLVASKPAKTMLMDSVPQKLAEHIEALGPLAKRLKVPNYKGLLDLDLTQLDNLNYYLFGFNDGAGVSKEQLGRQKICPLFFNSFKEATQGHDRVQIEKYLQQVVDAPMGQSHEEDICLASEQIAKTFSLGGIHISPLCWPIQIHQGVRSIAEGFESISQETGLAAESLGLSWLHPKGRGIELFVVPEQFLKTLQIAGEFHFENSYAYYAQEGVSLPDCKHLPFLSFGLLCVGSAPTEPQVLGHEWFHAVEVSTDSLLSTHGVDPLGPEHVKLLGALRTHTQHYMDLVEKLPNFNKDAQNLDADAETQYWSAPQEMGARAFEALFKSRALPQALWVDGHMWGFLQKAPMVKGAHSTAAAGVHAHAFHANAPRDAASMLYPKGQELAWVESLTQKWLREVASGFVQSMENASTQIGPKVDVVSMERKIRINF